MRMEVFHGEKKALQRRVQTSGTEAAVYQHAIDFPAHGQQRTSNELRKQGIFISATGVRGVWLRNELANFRDRLRALEAKVQAEDIILSDVQVVARVS